MGIAHELITRGWHQGDYEGPDGSVCLFGAAWKSSGLPLLEWEDEGYNVTSHALSGALLELHGAGSIACFNDAPERTYDEVLRVAKRADELLDAS